MSDRRGRGGGGGGGANGHRRHVLIGFRLHQIMLYAAERQYHPAEFVCAPLGDPGNRYSSLEEVVRGLEGPLRNPESPWRLVFVPPFNPVIDLSEEQLILLTSRGFYGFESWKKLAP